MLENQIINLIERYYDRQVNRSEFAGGFADLYFEARQNRSASRSSKLLCSSVIGPFSELSRGDRTEESFRSVLGNLLRTFGRNEFAEVAQIDPGRAIFDRIAISGAPMPLAGTSSVTDFPVDDSRFACVPSPRALAAVPSSRYQLAQ